MLPTHVALVPYDNSRTADLRNRDHSRWLKPQDLLHVAAALQRQAVRDLAPTWGTSCVVSPFLSVLDVPEDYAAVVILRRAPGEGTPLGFHLPEGRQPISLITHDRDWSLLASHELIEMLVDPFGTRTVPGPSPDPRAEEEVDCLVEVCDPCQLATYLIDGVLVSDFVTPAYYERREREDARYSFTGLVTRPRSLLEGGYITWRARSGDRALWQAFASAPAGRTAPVARPRQPRPAPDRSLRVGPLYPAAFSRNWIDVHSTRTRTRAAAPRPAADSTWAGGQPLAEAQKQYSAQRRSAESNGRALAREVQRILATLRPTGFQEADARQLISDLKGGVIDRSTFLANPVPELKRRGMTNPPPGPAGTHPPSDGDYDAALKALDDPNRFGVTYTQQDESNLTTWMAILGGF